MTIIRNRLLQGRKKKKKKQTQLNYRDKTRPCGGRTKTPLMEHENYLREMSTVRTPRHFLIHS